MSKAIKSKALILKKTKYSEADLILQAITPNGQKLSLIARGALKSKKRFGGGILEPTHYLDIQYRESRSTSNLLVLEEAQLINGFDGLRKDYDRLEVALRILEAVQKITQEGDEQSHGLFNLVGHTLKTLETTTDLNQLQLHFILKLLYQQGILEPETWMHVYLNTPMNEHVKLGETKVESSMARLQWAWNQLEHYLKNAERI